MSAPHWSEIECEWNNLQCPETPLCKTCAEAWRLFDEVKNKARAAITSLEIENAALKREIHRVLSTDVE